MFQFGIVTLAVFLSAVAAINHAPPVSAGRPPVNECPPGNLVAGKGCKWDLGFHEITSVEFRAYRITGADSCYAGFEFSPYDYQHDIVGAPHFDGAVYFGSMNALGEVNTSEWFTLYGSHSFRLYSQDFRKRVQQGNGSLTLRVSPSYKLGSQIPPSLVIDRDTSGPSRYLTFPSEIKANSHIQMSGYARDDIIARRAETPWLMIPAEVNDFSELVFECLENIRREYENQAMQEELRAKKAAEQRAADKARADAEAKAELQQIELEAAKQIQQKALETELFTTQALRSQLEQEKLIIAAWNKVVEIRLAGAQERAKITNAFMSEVEADKAAFVASVQTKVEELRRLQELNETLRTAIQAHNQTILDELAIQQALEEEQKQAIQDLEVKPSGTTNPSTPSN
jgi:hypothetical protein